MPPIPIHKNDPIAAAKPDGTTPQTATANPPPTRTAPASAPATTTTSSSSDPPAPQPGARPAPPTGSAYAPAPSTPAAPQPGAIPSAPGPSYTATHYTTETRYSGPPSQFSIPPPSDTRLAGRSTTTSTDASKPGPTQLNMGPVASPYQPQHSQGAVQGGERRSLENPPGYMQNPDNSPYAPGGNATGEQSGSGDAGIGGAAWNMLSKAGEALKKGEEAAWRAVGNK
ncbi:hypothetical protein BCR34DRAFT_596606 [Clohesyomyces aquaticus]|uniref:Uncharacterized protein n=1 Tax=Clohesyomyces aquaticus TaxID=1231657 RepID=A0A1Y2A6U6_9PLEO|nr:hypothetical protein BCR34DRAFT_596606 [Clohesyomyces aquaticus]